MAVNFDLRSFPAPSQAAKPDLSLTPAIVLKAAASLGITAMGMYFLMSGKENKDVQKMALGAILIIGAFFVF